MSIECPRCGNFEVAGLPLLKISIPQMEKKDRMRLSGWIRTKCPTGFVVTSENIEDILQALPSYKVSEQQLLLLRHLEGLTSHPGNPVKVNLDDDFTVIWALNGDELLFHLEELAQRGFVKNDCRLVKQRVVRSKVVTGGWAFLEDHPTLADVGNQVFVAMSFSTRMRPAFSDGIKPALTKAGYRAYRVDREPHIQRIDAKIEHEIRNSAFVVADVTEQKQGVYYEAGFAKGLGLPVIWTVNEKEKDGLHFDTRQYSHIIWTDEADLQERLYYLASVLPEVTERRHRLGP